MKTTPYILLLFLSCLACNNINEEKPEKTDNTTKVEIGFDRTKWATKDGTDYPYRDKMLNDIVYNDSLRALNQDEILDLLGQPDRTNENYLYYTIAQKRLGFWPLQTKTMVIKFSEKNTINWIKIHQ
jgi:hypothetical protein